MSDDPTTTDRTRGDGDARYFCFDGESFALHPSEEAARKHAEDALERYRDWSADDGWEDEVESICWGEIRQLVQMTACAEHDPECDRSDDCYESGCFDAHRVSPEHDYTCNFELRALEDE